MPITGEQVSIAYKLLPLTLFADGSSEISIRRGLQHINGEFESLTEKIVRISIDDTSSVLDTLPINGLTRRDDLSYAVYLWLVSHGEVDGIIS